ncbi:YtxH domain-containing protein [Chitinophaga sp. HK235]|uniref:YtxH domain-containing protein n=1 Tax=Chitinophaga sp. HK235 TaxID=2952571 RepID=UPI001BA56FFE|nr:YtxH domain-containing protein [Chitinophaga sp. HK235]
MQELIQQLQAKAGLTPEQAAQSIEVIKEYVKGKLPPFIAGTVDTWFANMSDKPGEKKDSLMDQANDFMDNVKDKAEDWKDKAEGWAEDAKDKITDFFKDKKQP